MTYYKIVKEVMLETSTMFTQSAAFYDAIYSFKNYEAESDHIHVVIQQYKRSDGNTLLDIACGTGMHDAYLRNEYEIVGIDLDEEMLTHARQRLPDVPYYQGDMRDFDLGDQFDAVICLFSSIGYLPDVEALNQTLANFYRHTKPGGVMLLEPWLQSSDLTPGHVGFRTVEHADFKIARMTHIVQHGKKSLLHMAYLIGKPEGVKTLEEVHDMTMFTHEEYAAAITAAGYTLNYDSQGLTNRGLYIGTRPE